MKYPAEQFEVLVKDLPVIFNHFGIDSKQDFTVSNLHYLHFKVYQQKNFTDDNANIKFVDGKRLLPMDESFLLYPGDCVDDNIETAMKAALKRINI